MVKRCAAAASLRGSHLLDVGCGDGAVLLDARDAGWTVQGLAFSEPVGANAAPWGFNVTIGRLEDRPFEQESFDGARLVALAPAAEGGWEGVDGSPAGFIRWRRVLELQDLRVDALGLGLGFAWAPPSTGTAARTLRTEIPVTGEASDVLLRALAGDGVARLRERAVQAGAEIWRD